jgi:hypothetical protein
MADRPTRLVGLYSVLAAAAAIVLAPLFALAYSRTPEGAEEFDSATLFAGWTERGIELAGGLLTFASADRVYSTYLQLFALLFPAIVLTALLARSRRPVPRGALERWAWRVALAGYALLAFGIVAIAVVLVVTEPSHPVVDALFLGTLLPGLLVSVLASTVLGLALLRSGYEPRVTPWLLALAVPLWLFGSFGLGHNSIGLVPLFVAWAATGWRLRQAAARALAESVRAA